MIRYVKFFSLISIIINIVLSVKADNTTSRLSINYPDIQQMIADGRYDEALAILPEYINYTSQSQKSIALSDMALCHFKTGHFESAVGYYNDAIKLSRTQTVKDRIRANLSNTFLEIGAYDKALQTLSEISTRELIPHKLINQAYAQFLINPDSYSDCFLLLDSCLTLNETSNFEHYYARQNKAYMMYELRQYEQAESLFENVLTQAPDSLSYYRQLGNYALTQAICGHYDNAVSNINKAVSYFSTKGYDDYIICLRKKAEILLHLGRKQSAYTTFKRFFDLNKAHITDAIDILSFSNKLNFWFKEKPLLSKCFMLEDYSPDFLYDVAMFRRQTSLLGMHNTGDLKVLLSSTSSDLKKSLGKNDVAIEFVSYTASNGKTRYAAIVLPREGAAKFVRLFDDDFLHQPLTAGGISVIDAIKNEVPSGKNRFYTDTTLANRIWQPIVRALPSKTKRVFFAPEGVFHFMGIENMPFEGKEKLELHRVSSTASLINRKNIIQRPTNKLLIGGLNYSAIPVDSVSVSYNHEAAEMLRQKAGHTNVFSYLPATRSEVDSIGTVLSDAHIRYNVGERCLKNDFPDFDLIHIATHGYSLNLGIRKRPEFVADSLAYDISLNASGLALTGANIASSYPDREDGLLSAREICELDLSNVDFVVLSACQTAQGDITDEGAAGLVRGLKNAGVHTILATLWSVDDKSTMLFMHEFYRLLNVGKTKHAAYTGAQEYLRSYNHRLPKWKFSARTLARERDNEDIIVKYDDPYYWAPFILIDDF